MARILFVAILAMCFVCMLQANPTPDQSTPVNNLDNALKGAVDSARQGYEAFVNDPTVKKMYDDLANLIAQGATAIREQAEKAIPKTE